MYAFETRTTQSSNKNTFTTRNSTSSERKRQKRPLFGSRVYRNKHLVDFVLINELEGVIDSDQIALRNWYWPQGSHVAEFRRSDWPSCVWMAFVLVKPIRRYGNLSRLSFSWRKPDFLWRPLSCGQRKVIPVFPNHGECIQRIYSPSWFFVTLRASPRVRAVLYADVFYLR